MYSLKIIRKHLAFYVVEIIITSLLFYSLVMLSLNVQVKVNGLSFFTLGVLAYFFGLRHAVDADHLAAIDNSTRKLIQEGKDSTFAGLFFLFRSLHSSNFIISNSNGSY
jgi:high-affinity nickel-transport protein